MVVFLYGSFFLILLSPQILPLISKFLAIGTLRKDSP